MTEPAAPSAEEIERHIVDRFADVQCKASWGERACFVNPGSRLPNGVYFATLKSADGAHDRASRLDRPGVFRLSLGIGRSAYLAQFGALPTRPAAGGVVGTGDDFSALDRLLPHPVYAWMGWVCVLNPSQPRLAALQPLLESAYADALNRLRRRRPPG